MSSPPFKRPKLGSHPSSPRPTLTTDASVDLDVIDQNTTSEAIDVAQDSCSICLQSLLDPTLIPTCSHEFCFECLLPWCEQSRRCPLCSQAIGDHVIHRIRSNWDYQTHYLPPLRDSESSENYIARENARRNVRSRMERDRRRRGRTEREETDRLDTAIAKRKWIYEHGLYAKVSIPTFISFPSTITNEAYIPF
jgi:hypothetical protein